MRSRAGKRHRRSVLRWKRGRKPSMREGTYFSYMFPPKGLLVSLPVGSGGASANVPPFLSLLSYTDKLHEFLPTLDKMVTLACYVRQWLVYGSWQAFQLLAGGGSHQSCPSGPFWTLVSERGDMWKQEMPFSWNSLPVLKFPPDHCRPDGVSALWLHDSSERTQGAHLLKRHPVPLLSICGWQEILYIETKNAFYHSLLSVLLLFSVSYMKLTWYFCILLSYLLEKRSQENLDSMRN